MTFKQRIIASFVYGITPEEADLRYESQMCISCARPAVEFKDDLSVKEAKITGLCQDCQDELFSYKNITE